MIKIVDDHKHIGLTYSSNCTWKTHLNNIHLYIPLCRTETLRNSFFPFTMKLWNALDESLKLSPSHEIFRIRLFNMFNPNKTKYYYYLGDMKCLAILSSLRTGCSQLNSDLF